jgi:hypothetical protein
MPPKKTGTAAGGPRRVYPGLADQSFDSTLVSNKDNYYVGGGGAGTTGPTTNGMG